MTIISFIVNLIVFMVIAFMLYCGYLLYESSKITRIDRKDILPAYLQILKTAMNNIYTNAKDGRFDMEHVPFTCEVRKTGYPVTVETTQSAIETPAAQLPSQAAAPAQDNKATFYLKVSYPLSGFNTVEKAKYQHGIFTHSSQLDAPIRTRVDRTKVGTDRNQTFSTCPTTVQNVFINGGTNIVTEKDMTLFKKSSSTFDSVAEVASLTSSAMDKKRIPEVQMLGKNSGPNKFVACNSTE